MRIILRLGRLIVLCLKRCVTLIYQAEESSASAAQGIPESTQTSGYKSQVV